MHVTHVILMGESALDERFLEVVRDALHDVLDRDVVLRRSLRSSSEMQREGMNPEFYRGERYGGIREEGFGEPAGMCGDCYL